MKKLTIKSMSPTLLTLASAITFASFASAQQNTTSAAQGAQPLNDGQILQIVRVLNDGEIKQAELAMEETASQEVMDVAEMILADHTNNNERIEMLEDDEDIELEDSPMSSSLEMQAQQTLERLEEAGDNMFDCAYVDAQIAQHEQALTAAEEQLLPNAQNEQVSQLLMETTPGLEAHLEMAEQAKESLQCS